MWLRIVVVRLIKRLLAWALRLLSWLNRMVISLLMLIGVNLRVIGGCLIIIQELTLKASIILSLKCYGELVLGFSLLNYFCFLPILLNLFLLHLDVVAYLQLILNQVFSLSKGANEFITLFSPQPTDLSFLNNLLLLKLFFFNVQTVLLINEIISKLFLFSIQISKLLEIVFEFVLLLLLYDFFDFVVFFYLFMLEIIFL